ncbi:TetR family transcriptional regulator [Streptomyces sp. NPDC005548]|uniref:TetR family transcriptional regulator n=1 Tax=Streptomyces sp. NPDC005548 TaxID=3364724 RepID=UPI0036BB4CC4
MTRQERAVRTREALIEAAAQLFDRDGYEVTSLAAVTAKAQVSAGALYFHFATKADLADAVTHAALSRLRRIIDARTATRTDSHEHDHGHGHGRGDEGGGAGAVAHTDGSAEGERVAAPGSPAPGSPASGGASGSPASGAPSGSPASGAPSGSSAPGAGGGRGPDRVGELQQLIDTTHLFVRGLSRDVVLRAGFGLDGAWGERPVGERAVEQGPVGQGPVGRGPVGRGAAGRRVGGERPSGRWPHVGGGLRGVWSGWVHEVLTVAGARGVLASGVSAGDAAVVVVAATVGFEVLGAQDPVWLAPDPLTGFWTLVLPALVPSPIRSVLQAGGSTTAH